MKKIIILITVIMCFYSCKKEAESTTTEVTTESTDSSIKYSDVIKESEYDNEDLQTESINPDYEEHQEATRFQELEELYKNQTFSNLNESNLNSVKFKKSTENYIFPVFELNNDLCASASNLKIRDLNSSSGFELYHLTKNNSATLSALGFTGSFGDKETIIIKDYVRSKNLNCNGKTYKMGIGLRCFIHVKSKNYKGGANLANLAANVQLNKVTANYKIVSLGFGISGKEFSNIKSSGSYDVNSFLEIENAFDKIMGYLSDENSINIDPVPLP